MKKLKVYIFNKESRAAIYGIGTYIDQLIKCFNNAEISFEVIHLYSEGKEVSVSEKDGYKQFFIPMVQSYRNKNAQYYYRNVAYLLREFILPKEKNMEYIIHLNFMSNPDLVIHLKKMFHCKVVLVAHYTDWSFSLLGNFQRLKNILSKKANQMDAFEKLVRKQIKEDEQMIAKCNRLVCVAQHTKDTLLSFCRIDSSKCLLINNAIEDVYIRQTPVKKQKLRKKYHFPDDVPIILFAGRLDEVKGISYLIKAFKNMLPTHPQAHLIIVGEGDFSSWIKEAGDCWTKITFTGRLDKKRLYEFYSIADIGVVCSLHEEFGLVALEMMMHELPLIVTKTGGLDEIVEENVSGLKVPVRTRKGQRQVNVRCLSEKIRFMLENPSIAKDLGENGRKRFLEKYELAVFREKMLNLYQNL